MLDIVGLLFELLFLAAGVYLYLFAIGKINFADRRTQEQASRFREKNRSWLRILALGMTAIMSINVLVHLLQLLR